MASRKWDAYRTLNIVGRGSYGTTCVGETTYGKRCRWDISTERFRSICSILDEMEKKPPKEASDFLPRLAQLSLCLDYHQDQADIVADDWQSGIDDAASEYEKSDGLRSRIEALEKALKEEKANGERLRAQVCELNGKLERQTPNFATALDHLEMRIDNGNLTRRVEQLEGELVESRGELEKLKKSLVGQRSQLSSELELERQKTAKLKKDLKESNTVRDAASEGLADLTSQAITDAKKAAELRKQSAKEKRAKEKRANQKKLVELKENLDQVEERHAASLKESEALRSRLATEVDKSGKLHLELATITTELTSSNRLLEITQFELKGSRQVSDEQAIVAAARETEIFAERARMLERMGQLEKQLSASFLQIMLVRFKRMVRGRRFWALGVGLRRWDFQAEGVKAFFLGLLPVGLFNLLAGSF
jgi:chromosome segregation ATPase